MSSGKPSITAVARQAGVSISTASQVLGGSKLFAPETVTRVRQIAEEMGYVPDPRYRAMGQAGKRGKRRTGSLGLLLPGDSSAIYAVDPYHARMFWSIEAAARKANYHMTVSTIGTEDMEYLPDFVSDLRVDGVLMASFHNPPLAMRISTLVPVVLVSTHVESAAISSVAPDEVSTIRQALDYLVNLGHKRITFFDVHDSYNWHHQARTQAFEAMAMSGPGKMPLARSVVLTERTRPLLDIATELLLEWQAQGQMPTALLCAADIYALEFMKAAEKTGIKVPQQLSLLGIDDTSPCVHTSPTLTSVRQPMEAMGRAAVQLLLQRIASPDDPATCVSQQLNVELKIRESCTRPLRAD